MNAYNLCSKIKEYGQKWIAYSCNHQLAQRDECCIILLKANLVWPSQKKSGRNGASELCKTETGIGVYDECCKHFSGLIFKTLP